MTALERTPVNQVEGKPGQSLQQAKDYFPIEEHESKHPGFGHLSGLHLDTAPAI